MSQQAIDAARLKQSAPVGKLPGLLRIVPPSVGEQVARLAAASFQGRDLEIRRITELVCSPDLLPRVLCVTGPPGVGKSALMEAVRWRLQAAGLADVLLVNMRDFDHTPEAVERLLLERAAPWPRQVGDKPLVLVLDGYDSVSVAERRSIREGFTAELTGPVLAAFCERRPPADLLVAQVGWRAFTEEMRVGPLQAGEATALLEAHGVTGEASAALALEAMGNPLLTAVAGDVTIREADPERWPDRLAEEATRLLAGRLRQEGLDAHGGFAMVEAASLEASVNEERLGAMLRRDLGGEFSRFTALSIVVEQASGEYAVVEPFRSLVARDVRRRRPRVYDEMRAAANAAQAQQPFVDPRTHPSRELVPDVKSALEWLRLGRLGDPCDLALRLHLADEGGAARLNSMLTGIVLSLVRSRAPRVSEAGRLLMYYYFDRAASSEAVAERMNISRATAFRRLSLGIELVAERLPIS